MSKNDQNKTPELWKDRINRDSVRKLAESFAKVHKRFKVENFVTSVCDPDLSELELKQRIERVALRLNEHLPDDFIKATAIVNKVAPRAGMFENWALTEWVAKFGLEHFKTAIDTLEFLTKHGTAEFAVRPFIKKYPDEMLKVLIRWANDPNEHVRRLAAEGSRPRGVWIGHLVAFIENPQPVIQILNNLKTDSSKYVRIAVANNLNDISKDHPELVIDIARQWKQLNNPDTDWIVKHGCRTLIKQGVADVFPLFGFTTKPKVLIKNLNLSASKLSIGDTLAFSFNLTSQAKTTQKLAIDYRLHYVKNNGKTIPKMFKLREMTIASGQTVHISAKRSLANMSTRKHYAGEHRIELVINGRTVGKIIFELTN